MRHMVTENGAAIQAATGDEIVIQLHEVATAGYAWQLPDTLPAGLAAFDVEPDAATSHAIGGENLHLMGFRITAPGKYAVCLQQYRSWEGPSKAIGSFSFTVSS